MRSLSATAIAVILLQLLCVPALAQTVTGALPSETTAARKEIQKGMAAVFTNTKDEAFPGATKADIGRAKACAVQALMADMPDDVAEELVVQLRDTSVRDDEFFLHWLMPGEKDVARRNQIDARAGEICPELLQPQ
ncbi:hypothetical protein [Dongia sp. agr-C8]